jgi:hypothetical protein
VQTRPEDSRRSFGERTGKQTEREEQMRTWVREDRKRKKNGMEKEKDRCCGYETEQKK